MPTARALLLVALALALPAAGCVERKFLIRSEPAGAEVRVNGMRVGRTPVEIPFDHYGVVRLEADPVDLDGDGYPEYEGFSEPFPLDAPWYQWFPVEFFSDNLWPGTLVDRHSALLVLKPAIRVMAPDAATQQEVDDELRRRATNLRIRAQKERVLQETAPPVEKK